MPQNHNLTNDPIPELIRKLAIPASVGFLFNTMFNVVDTWYGGLISTDALAALSLSFPVFFIIIAIGNGTGTGATALIANALGNDDRELAELYAAQSITFGVIISVAVMIVGLVSASWLFEILGATGAYLSTAVSYITIIFGGTIFFILSNIFNAALTALGDTRTFRNTLIVGSLLNLILDPWFIYGGFGMPAMGFDGIATATVFIQGLICLYIAYRSYQADLINRRSLRMMAPKSTIMKELLANCVPASLNLLTVGIGIFIITFYVSKFGKNAVAGFGIAMRIEQIVLLPIIGLNMATLALVGQNFGAGNFLRVRETLYTCLRYGCITLLPGGIALVVFAGHLMGLFTDVADVIRHGTQYLQIAALILWAYVILFVTTSALQGMKKPAYAIWIGLYRQIVAPLFVFHFLAYTLGWDLYGIWWGIFLVTWSAAIFTLYYARLQLRRYAIDQGRRVAQS